MNIGSTQIGAGWPTCPVWIALRIGSFPQNPQRDWQGLTTIAFENWAQRDWQGLTTIAFENWAQRDWQGLTTIAFENWTIPTKPTEGLARITCENWAVSMTKPLYHVVRLTADEATSICQHRVDRHKVSTLSDYCTGKSSLQWSEWWPPPYDCLRETPPSCELNTIPRSVAKYGMLKSSPKGCVQLVFIDTDHSV